MSEQVVSVGMGGEPGDHRNAEPVHVIGELVKIGTVDAEIDQDQPILSARHDGIARWVIARRGRTRGGLDAWDVAAL